MLPSSLLHRSRSDRHPHTGASSRPPWADSHSAILLLLIYKLTCPLPLFVHVLPLSGGVFHETWLENTLSVAPNKQWKDPAPQRQTAPVKHMTCATLQDDRSQSSRGLGEKKQEWILVQTSGQQAETNLIWNTEQSLRFKHRFFLNDLQYELSVWFFVSPPDTHTL